MSPLPILLIGGAGTVGKQTAMSLRAAHPNTPLLIGGRDLARAKQAAAEIGGGEGVQINLTVSDLGLGDRAVSAVAIFVHDDTLGSLSYALSRSVPHVSISTGTFEIAPEIAAYVHRPTAPVVLGSEWLAGAAVLTTLHLAKAFARLDRIALSAVLDEQDIGGPAADADYARLTSVSPAALTLVDGRYHWRTPAEGEVVVHAADGEALEGFAYSPFDIVALAARTDAKDIRLDVAVGASSSRRAGQAYSTEILIDLEGVDRSGAAVHSRHAFVHPRGQAPLTALAVASILERVAALDGAPPVGPGLYFPEGLLDPDLFVTRALASGATLIKVKTGQ